ncbi:MAG TPA: CysB family HTH-type transcriptional regulator [Hyphomicrobium sp.]|nr:CysB family HTH-type transcriptional regulator [Hyphomicrobium sp.]
MNLQQLKIIRETIRHKFNLTDAASALFTSQSGVSKHIRDLEEELGVEIFVRRGKRLLGLTEPGVEVADIVERILIESDNLRQVASNYTRSDEGRLTIATTHTQARYALPTIIATFKLLYPDVRLTLQQASPKELPRILLEGHADLAIATDTLEQHPGLSAFPYHSWEHIIVAPKDHPLLAVRDLTLTAISEHPIITYDEGLTGRTRIDEAFERAGCSPDIAITALDADIIKAYVAMGMGIGIIAGIAFDAEADTKLVALPAHGLFQTNTSSIAIRRGRMLRSYVYRFIELCSPGLTEDVVRGQSHKHVVEDYDI